jgi:cytoskeleton protein RodZ
MSDEKSKAEEQDEGPVGGERLRVARRANDISVRDVAKELHLDEYKVRALEKNEFDVLGAPVFAKGHLRKYAELVGVSVDDVMTDYYQMNRATGAPPVVGSRPKPPREINLVPWIVAAVIIILVGGAAWWWFGLRSPTPAPAAEPAAIAPFIEPAAEDETVLDAAPDTTLETAAEPEAEGPEPAPQVSTAATPSPEAAEPEVAATDVPESEAYEPTPGAAQVSVALSFSGDCWTEVSDGSGRRLFYDLGSAGRIVNLSGDAPLRLILGDADNVSITVEGEPWPIPASARRGQLARLSIAAP